MGRWYTGMTRVEHEFSDIIPGTWRCEPAGGGCSQEYNPAMPSERRLVAILFTDIVDSTALIAQLENVEDIDAPQAVQYEYASTWLWP